MIDIRLVAKTTSPAVDAVAVPVRKGADGPEFDPAVAGAPAAAEVTGYRDETGTDGAAGRVETLPRPGRRPRTVYLVGVGTGTPADLRRAGAMLVRAARRDRRVTAVLDTVDPAGLRAFVEGAGLAAYRFSRASTPPEQKPGRLDVAVAAPTDPDLVAAHGQGLAVVRAVHLARDLANTPAMEKTPQWLADQAVRRLGAAGAKVVVRDEDWLRRSRFGGVLAVGGGSARPPRLIEATWRPRDADRHVVLVGKGITFDTGGISIKPADAMVPMKTDMAGGAAVLAAVQAAAELRLPIRITALVPAAENAVSGSAYRPADVLRHPNGRTTEVTNTDAEGRIVLADALAYATARLAPDALVDVATLTGAMRIALGTRTAGLFATDDALATALLAAGTAGGEQLWRMPLVEDYLPRLDSDVADAVNASAGSAGGTVAALFLRPFAAGRPWAHLDIAGPGRAGADDGEISRGATGFGVRTLIRWLEAGAPAGG